MFRQQRPRAAIVDLDGTLVNSVDAHARAWVAAFREAGFDVSIDQVRSLLGMPPDQLLAHLIGLPRNSDDAKSILRSRAEIFRTRFLGKIAPFLGARALLEKLKRQDTRITVAASNSESEASGLLVVAGVADLVDEVVTADDARRFTPEADLIQVAIRYAGSPRDATIVLGDTPFDVESGRRAGASVIAFRCGGWGDAALVGATAIYDDPRDLLNHFGSSPFCPVPSVEYAARPISVLQPARAM